MAAIIESPPRPLETLKPGLPDEFLRIVRGSMAKEPARRYQSALDLRNALEDLKQTLGSTTPKTPPPGRARRSFARAGGPMAASAIAILVAGLGYLLGARNGTAPSSVLDGRFRRLT